MNITEVMIRWGYAKSTSFDVRDVLRRPRRNGVVMMRGTPWSLLVAALVIVGCARTYVASYDIGLVEAKRPVESEQQYGTDLLEISSEGGMRVSYFEDGLVSIVWHPGPSGIAFELTNRLDQSIEIDWEASIYVDEKGASHRIIHSGVESAAVERRQSPSQVAPGEKLSQVVRSADNVSFESGIHPRWRETPLLPVTDNNGPRLTMAAEECVGKKIELVLALRVGGENKPYSFIFAVEGVEVNRKTGEGVRESGDSEPESR
jgi:hypothetical protein